MAIFPATLRYHSPVVTFCHLPTADRPGGSHVRLKFVTFSFESLASCEAVPAIIWYCLPHRGAAASPGSPVRGSWRLQTLGNTRSPHCSLTSGTRVGTVTAQRKSRLLAGLRVARPSTCGLHPRQSTESVKPRSGHEHSASVPKRRSPFFGPFPPGPHRSVPNPLGTQSW